jgi:SAM-dependent methyltransferase
MQVVTKFMDDGNQMSSITSLDNFVEKYLQPPDVEVENDLIMNWYPKRIIARTGRVNRLLELGLGHGYTVPYFEATSREHVVVEGSSKVIEYFRAAHPEYRGKLEEAYFETFEPTEAFDIIVMGFVLEHVNDPVAILQRYRRFLRKDGRIYVVVPNAKSLNRRFGLAMGMIDDIYDLNETDHKLGHQRNFCRATLANAVREAGYAITHEEGIYLKPLPLNVLKTLDNMDSNLQAMLEVGIDFPDLCVAMLLEIVAYDTAPSRQK